MITSYFKSSAGYAGVAAILVSVMAIAGALFGVFAITAAASFVVLFPIVLMTLPAIKAANRKAGNSLAAWFAHAEEAKDAKEAAAQPQ